jgi:hypothetical protein
MVTATLGTLPLGRSPWLLIRRPGGRKSTPLRLSTPPTLTAPGRFANLDHSGPRREARAAVPCAHFRPSGHCARAVGPC